MKTPKFILSLFVLFGLNSCNNSASSEQTNDTSTSNNLTTQTISNNIRQTLAGQIFLFAPELDSINVKATGACDCCSSSVLFISDTTFVDLGYCESSTVYSKGSYSLDNEKLVLTYKDLVVNKDYNWKKETDTLNKNLVDYFYKTENITNQTKTYTRQNVVNKMVFKDTIEYGTIDNERSLNEEIRKMKTENIWSMLKM